MGKGSKARALLMQNILEIVVPDMLNGINLRPGSTLESSQVSGGLIMVLPLGPHMSNEEVKKKFKKKFKKRPGSSWMIRYLPSCLLKRN